MTSTNKVDGVFRMRSLGTATQGITDQSSRTQNYKKFLVNIMREKRVRNVLDAACGTGVDSVMLLEEGFKMTSSDASDKMLKGAHKTRRERRKEPLFDDWVIEE